MKEQSKTSEKELSDEHIANLSDGELKALVIKMLTELIELGQKMKEQMKGTQNEIKQNIQGTNSDRKETRTQSNDLEQKEETTRIQKSEERLNEALGQPATFQYPNHRGARKRRGRPRNLKLICTTNKGKLPQSGKANRLPGSPGSPENLKEVGPKEEHTKAHHH